MDPEILHQAPFYALFAALGFMALAVVLLYPVWRFLKREEEVSRFWTVETLADRRRHTQRGDGLPEEPAWPPPDSSSG